MKVLREITHWDVDYRQPNHTYLIQNDKIVAYKKWHEGDAVISKKPVRLDQRYRKFEELDYNEAEWGVAEKPQNHIRVVQGSKGNTYEVDDERGVCSCPGYTFRGTCKHLAKNG